MPRRATAPPSARTPASPSPDKRYGVAAAALVGVCGGAVFHLLGLPLAWLLGAMAAIFLMLPTRVPLHLPRVLHHAALVAIGVLIGSRFQPETLPLMLQWWAPIVLVLSFLVISVVGGWLYFRHVAGCDSVTALLCASPAGLNVMLAYVESLGGDVRRVILVHAMRVISIVVAVPLLLLVLGYDPPSSPADLPVSGDGGALSWLAVMACAVLGYCAARWVPVAAGLVIWPMALSAVVHIAGLEPVTPPVLLLAAIQVTLGIMLGLRLAGVRLNDAAGSIMHGTLWGVGLVATAALLAWLASFRMGFAFAELLLSLTPGGLPEMSLVALGIGADVAFVVVCNVVRFVTAVVLVPVIVPRLSGPGAADGAED